MQIVVILLILAIANTCYSAGNTAVAVTATIVSKSNCKFNSASAALDFGSLDPGNPTDKTVNTSITFVCHGSANPATFSIGDDDGLYETGSNANRMRHTIAAAEYLPYSFSLNPETGTVPKNTDQTLTITGTVRGVDFQDAYVGSYSDSVTLTISP
jgi:spore coat protein U-like protein